MGSSPHLSTNVRHRIAAVRRFFRRATLEDVAARGDTKRLLKALALRESDLALTGDEYTDLEWRRREEAATRLADLPGDEVTDALVAAVGDFTPEVRLAALRSLVARPGTREAEMLRAVLSWRDADARRAGAELLVERADADGAAAARILVAYVGDDAPPDHVFEDAWAPLVFGAIDERARKATMEHAVRLWLETSSGIERVRQVVHADEELGVDALVARFESDIPRREIAILLGELRNSRATGPLVSLLRAASPADREAAARALGRIQDPRAVTELLQVSADSVFAVRDAAQRALDAMGTAGVVWSVAAASHGALDGQTQLSGNGEVQRLLAAPEQP